MANDIDGIVFEINVLSNIVANDKRLTPKYKAGAIAMAGLVIKLLRTGNSLNPYNYGTERKDPAV